MRYDVLAMNGLVIAGEGRNRIVYISRNGRYVYKVPKNPDGQHDNWSEAKQFRCQSWLSHNQMARCRLAHSGILVMERVETKGANIVLDGFRRWPKWTDFVDCQQVGYNRLGMLVAYDYA